MDQCFLLSFVDQTVNSLASAGGAVERTFFGKVCRVAKHKLFDKIFPQSVVCPHIAFIVIMADMKRKRAIDTKSQTESIQKKHKKGEESHKPSKPVEPLEAEADSDPIIESDTGSQSGEDDGVSWPSDNEGGGGQKEVELWEGASEGGSGVEKTGFEIDSGNAPQAKPKFKSTEGVGTGKTV